MTILERRGSIRLEGMANPVFPTVKTVLIRDVVEEMEARAYSRLVSTDRAENAGGLRPPDDAENCFESGWVEVMKTDMFRAATYISELGTVNVGILCMGSTHPGGGVMRGARAQEEDLYRRSDIYRHNKMFITKERQYPLAMSNRGRNEGIAMATPNVLVFRDDIATGYEILNMARRVTVITAVGPVRPSSTIQGDSWRCLDADDKLKMFATIKAIVESAKEAKCRVLILSAFGCGAYENLQEKWRKCSTLC